MLKFVKSENIFVKCKFYIIRIFTTPKNMCTSILYKILEKCARYCCFTVVKVVIKNALINKSIKNALIT